MKNITNKLGQIGSQYIKHTNSIKQDIANMDDLNILLKYLPLLKLDNNYLLDDARPRKRTNSHLFHHHIVLYLLMIMVITK